MDKYKRVYIEWCDALSAYDEWTDISEVLEWADTNDWIVKEIGFILKETKQYILLASRINEQHDTDRISSCIKIPKTWILKREDL